MAKGPAVVVVARHGARLDAADKTWHLTSPTPYDPPLTYGGWTQGKALGLRIAALLHQRDVEQDEDNKDADLAHLDFSKLDAPQAEKARAEGAGRRKKKRKIVIHSSPYLRCIQTSTAVAAGISQYQPPVVPTLGTPAPTKEKTPAPEPAPTAKPSSTSSYMLQSSTLQPLANPALEVFPKPYNGPERILLRIDAFLGEWLSPDYYEDITPPPNSTLMVAGAKADLLRRGDSMQEMSDKNNSKGFFPGGWGAKAVDGVGANGAAKASSPALRSLASVGFLRERSSSYDGSTLERTKSREDVAALVPPPRNSRVYEPPVPTYSISPADPIPRGYFAHAREACVLVDFQWDSVRPPQEWGDGGEYGDEWSTMHKRFRRGLAGMMDWYREHGIVRPKDQISGFMFKEPLRLTPHPVAKPKNGPSSSSNGESDVEDDEELVLIILTHGAGCNALLGAMTNQPVLIDVGLASLSMAVRRKEPVTVPERTITERRPSVADTGMAETYEMKLMASVDHLKPGTDPARLQSQSQVNSPLVQSSPLMEARRRFTGSSGASSPLDAPFTLGEPYRTWNSSVRRTWSSGSNKLYTQSNLNPGGGSALVGGLWSSPKLTPLAAAKAAAGERPSSSSAAPAPRSDYQQPKPKPSSTSSNDGDSAIQIVDGAADITNGLERLNTNEQNEVSDSVAPLSKPRERTGSSNAPALWGAKAQPKSNAGLWGPPILDDVYEHRRGLQPKRRWTVTEREESL